MATIELGVTLRGNHAAFTQALVGDGRYNTAAEVVGAALELLEERQARIDAINQALIDGENSGVATEFDIDAFLAEMHAEVEAEGL